MTTPRDPEPPGRGPVGRGPVGQGPVGRGSVGRGPVGRGRQVGRAPSGHGAAGGRGGLAGRSGSAGRGRSSLSWSPLRAIAVLAVAVGLGAYLIDLGSGTQLAASSKAPTTTTTTVPTTVPKSTTTTTVAPSGTQPSKAVKVLVANASETDGIATYYSEKLASAGWGTLTPVTATTTFSSSSVYYATGEEKAGRAVAGVLGVPSTAVQPLGPTTPVSDVAGADVVVVAGDDLAAKAPSSTSTSTTASSTATASASSG